MSRNFKKEEEELVRHFEAGMEATPAEILDINAYETIVDYYSERCKYQKALMAVNQAMRFYPFSDELLPLKAHVLSKMQRYEEALRLLEKMRRAHPYDMEIWFSIASIFFMQQRYEEAIFAYRGMLTFLEEEYSDKDEIYYQMGLSYRELQNPVAAIKAYRKTLKINPRHEDALHELACCLESIGKLNRSIFYYKKIIDQTPYSAEVWNSLAMVYEKLKKYRKALDAYGYVAAINEHFPAVHFNIGSVYMKLAKYKPAAEAFWKAIDLEGPSAPTYFALGTVHEKLLQYGLAIKYYQRTTKIDPLYDEAWCGIGNCLAQRQQWYQALHFFNKALKLERHNPTYWKYVARAETHVGNVISSIKAYERAYFLEPGDKDVPLEWSLVHHKQGEHQKAIQVIEMGIEENPKSAEMLYHLVVYLLDHGEPRRAFDILEKALKVDFDKHSILFEFFSEAGMSAALRYLIRRFDKRSNA